LCLQPPFLTPLRAVIRHRAMVMDPAPVKKSRKHPGKVDRRKTKAPYGPYRELLGGVVRLIEHARLAAV